MKTIAVIGGGASGIAASITAADCGAHVCLLEAGKRIGHSIMVSGNGRCNWSNSRVDAADYTNAGFVAQAFGACSPSQVREWFADLGLVWLEEADGRLYPQANKSSSVLDVLRFALDERGVRVECEHPVARVSPAGATWSVVFEDGSSRRFDAAVVACGGGISQSLLPEGFRFTSRKPRLCGMRTDRVAVKGLDNIRVKAEMALRDTGGSILAKERGEVQFRPYGVSGIVAFNLSRFATVGDTLEIDLLPECGEASLNDEMRRRMRRFPRRSAEQLLAGMVLPAVARAVLRQAGCKADAALQETDACCLCESLKRFRLTVEGFEEAGAQVRQGGVAVQQVDPATMQVRRHAGLFVTGEALDVDGPCGGYNLHWAWTSGLLAGAAAAGRGAHA